MRKKRIVIKTKFLTILFLLLFITGIFLIKSFSKFLSLSFTNPPITVPFKARNINEKIVAAAGDISCDFYSSSREMCQGQQTSDLIINMHPQYVFALGDLQYGDSSLSDFNTFYDKTWGRFKNITYPVIGNHEYGTSDAAGYFAYFGKRAGDKTKGYYSFTIDTWQVVVINSNCWAVGGCEKKSAQYKWLLEELKNNKCTLAVWHHPRFSSGQHGDNVFMQDIWELLAQKKVDVVLSGHDHVYERFGKVDAYGEKDPEGVRSFIVGTGGRSLYTFTNIHATSEVRNNTHFGVLKLALYKDAYSWDFISKEPTLFQDKGNEKCR